MFNQQGELASNALVIKDIHALASIDIESLDGRMTPTGCLLCKPAHFQVREVINDFMINNIDQVNPDKALHDWTLLHNILKCCGPVEIIDDTPNCPDMIFAANAALTVGCPRSLYWAVMSNMVHKIRRDETPLYEKLLQQDGYQTLRLPEGVFFEGQGDALLHPGKMLLWGGYGQRSSLEAYSHISSWLNMPVIVLKLISKLYHLDTCFCPLDGRTVLYCPDAFTQVGQEMIEWVFPDRIQVSLQEAETFVCNAIVRPRKTVILAQGAEFIAHRLERRGFIPIFTPMNEMKKSGGGPKCCELDLH